MSVTIAMPRMSTDPELTTAQSKYVESLARAGAEVHWVELSDPDAAAAEALTTDRSASPPAVSRTFCGTPPSRSCCGRSSRQTSRCWASAGAFR